MWKQEAEGAVKDRGCWENGSNYDIEYPEISKKSDASIGESAGMLSKGEDGPKKHGAQESGLGINDKKHTPNHT